MLDAGLSHYLRDNVGATTLTCAARGGFLKVVAMLLSAVPADDRREFVNEVGRLGETALMGAASHGYMHVCFLLCSLGADIYARDTWGDSAIDYAHR